MYAAAGGASLASRQARQRQRQQKKTQQLQAKLHPPKAPGLVAAEHGTTTPTRQSRQFHQLPTNYLRTPQSAYPRKLSASYTGQSKLQLLPIDEGDTQSVLHMRMHSHTHAHAHMHQNAAAAAAATAAHAHAHTHPSHHTHHHYVQREPGLVSPPQPQPPKLVHRHSGSSGTSFHHTHLPKSATATLPLVSQVEATPPTTPSSTAVKTSAENAAAAAAVATLQTMQVPQDSIIVTPATPMASPGHVSKQQQLDELPDHVAEQQPLTSSVVYDDDEPMQPPTAPLERKCSVYRMRRSDAFEQDGTLASAAAESTSSSGVVGFLGAKKPLRELQFQQQYEPLILDEPSMVFKGLPNGRKWQPCAYCEEGICVCEHIECAQGRAAWLERGRRCSVQDSQQAAAACHRRWVKRNRIQDASLGGSSDDEDFLGVLRGPSTFANAFLYVGLGTIALGLVIAFVGTGEKGFKTVELRLIGPSLIGLGLICCILRILFCICPSHCISSGKKSRKKNGNKVDADHTTSLLRGENKRVSIARGPSMQKYPIAHKRSNSKMLNEGMEALRQIATTSLFMQNEQKANTNRVVPIIKEPDNATDAPLEMKKLETALNVCEISDDENEQPPQPAATSTKANAAAHKRDSGAKAAKTTTATVVNEKPPLLRSSSKLSRQRVALNQQPQPQQISLSSPPPPPHQQQPLSSSPLQQQSQSLSSSSTVKDSIDGDLLMETSLMVLHPAPNAASEARPPAVTTNTTTATAATTTTSRGATPRLPKTPPIAAAPATTSTPTSSTSTGAVPRVLSAPLSYDLPSATPHRYTAAASTTSSSTLSTSRSVASALLASVVTERESRVRGPLGMPLSALTATTNRYASASINAKATAAAATTTTISLLPLPAPPTASAKTAEAAPATAAAACLPGQVMQSDATTTTTTTTESGVKTTSLSILLPITTTTSTTTTNTRLSSLTNSQPSALLLPPPTAATPTSALSSLKSGSIFKFPAPLTTHSLSSSTSSSAASSAGSHGRSAAIGGGTLAPPPTSTVSKFEPELVLSPAKLGQ